MKKTGILERAARWVRASLIILLVACGGWLVEMCGSASAAVPVTEVWSHRYGNVVGGADDLAFRAVCDADGNIIVTGSTENYATRKDMLTIKYSGTNGSVLWQRRYNGPASEDDVPQDIGVDASGNVLVTGYSLNSSNYSDIYTAKYAAADGALLWECRYDGGAGLDDYGSALAVDGQDNVIVRGDTQIGPDFYIYLAKLSPAGVVLWEQHGTVSGLTVGDVGFDGAGDVIVTGTCSNGFYTAKHSRTNGALLWEQCGVNAGNGYGRAVAADVNGDVLVAGELFHPLSEPFEYDYDLRTAKFSGTNGALLWERCYNGPGNYWDIVHALAVDQAGNAIVAGYSYGTNSGPDAYTAKYAAADGALLWERRYNGPGNGADFLLAADLDGAGNVLVVGYSFNGSKFDFYVAKYAASDGAVLWENRSAGPPDRAKFGQALAVNGQGDVLATGYFATPPWDVGDYYTAKFAGSDGALQWEQSYDGPWETEDRAVAVALDSAGNVVTTGYSEPARSAPFDFYTAKYAATNGALLWERRYQGPQGHDQPADMAVDATGNVIVTGTSYGDGTYADYYTAKYTAADGALLWEKRYNGPANSFDEPVAVAADGQQNVVVTGRSVGTSSGFDFYTVKYAAGDGALLWERRDNGPSNSADIVYALALDLNGDVAVTGTTTGPGGYPDIYTARHASTNGALLWERGYDGPAHLYDEPVAVGTDQFGNVFVTGRSFGTNDAGFNTADIYTAKYAAANGALLWERRYSSDFVGEARALAVDASGNVMVTGFFYDDDEEFGLIIKYASADGAVLWQKNSAGGGRSVAVDENGHVVVAGEFLNGYNRDYYLAKFASADGALLWEEHRDGPGHRDDTLATPHSLALGSNGVIALAGYSGFGTANQADYMTFLYQELPPPVSISLGTNGPSLRFSGVPGRSYTIERAPTVTGPWSIRFTVLASPSGFVEFLDTNASPDTAFYRSRSP